MIHITNSIFRTFLSCPAMCMAQYEGRIKGDTSIKPKWSSDAKLPMACGSLVDSIVTGSFRPKVDDDSISPIDFYEHLKSSYDDGMLNAELLTKKNGGWNSDAKKAITAAYKLKLDPKVSAMLQSALFQKRLSFMLDEETVWEGDIDILTVRNEMLQIIDLKSPAGIKDGWIISEGKNMKVPYQDSWQYWFQLAGYEYGLAYGKDARLNGVPLSDIPEIAGKYPLGFRRGILVATREDHPYIGYIPLSCQTEAWSRILRARKKNGGPSKLEIFKAIAKGEIKSFRCNDPECDYCSDTSSVDLDKDDLYAPQPVIDDLYDFRDLDDFNIYSPEY